MKWVHAALPSPTSPCSALLQSTLCHALHSHSGISLYQITINGLRIKQKSLKFCNWLKGWASLENFYKQMFLHCCQFLKIFDICFKYVTIALNYYKSILLTAACFWLWHGRWFLNNAIATSHSYHFCEVVDPGPNNSKHFILANKMNKILLQFPNGSKADSKSKHKLKQIGEW